MVQFNWGSLVSCPSLRISWGLQMRVDATLLTRSVVVTSCRWLPDSRHGGSLRSRVSTTLPFVVSSWLSPGRSSGKIGVFYILSLVILPHAVFLVLYSGNGIPDKPFIWLVNHSYHSCTSWSSTCVWCSWCFFGKIGVLYQAYSSWPVQHFNLHDVLMVFLWWNRCASRSVYLPGTAPVQTSDVIPMFLE